MSYRLRAVRQRSWWQNGPGGLQLTPWSPAPQECSDDATEPGECALQVALTEDNVQTTQVALETASLSVVIIGTADCARAANLTSVLAHHDHG